MKLTFAKVMPQARFSRAAAGSGKARQAHAPGADRDRQTKKRGVIGKLRDMCCSRKTAIAAHPAQLTPATSQTNTQTPVPPTTSQQLCSAPAASKPAATPAAAVQTDAQLTQQAAQAVAAKAVQMLECRAERQKQEAQPGAVPAASRPAAVSQPAEELGRVSRMDLAERIAQMLRAQQTQLAGSHADDSSRPSQPADAPSPPQQRASSSSGESVVLQQPAQRPRRLMLQEDFSSFSPVVMPGDSHHVQLIHISRSLMTRSSPFEHDPKMLAWEIAAVQAGSFRRAPPMPKMK